jgi:hypothetical protein
MAETSGRIRDDAAVEQGSDSAKLYPDVSENGAGKQQSPSSESVGSRAKAAKKTKKHGRKAARTKKRSRAGVAGTARGKAAKAGVSNYPRHVVDRVLRIPKAILEQNAGRDTSDQQAAAYLGVKLAGPTRMEIASAIKYGFLERPAKGQLRVTDLAKRVLRPQDPAAQLSGLREAVLNAPVISDVYLHYRGENLPDQQFFDNTLADTFHIPAANLSEFKSVFVDSLRVADLLEEHGDKLRVHDVSQKSGTANEVAGGALRRLELSVTVDANDTCFVVMPFAPPLGNHYKLIYEPAIEKAGLRSVRADSDIFATGKIIDQVWAGISTAKVLVAELTSRNPNVFYELGIAHALHKPVVLISATEDDVPFDVRHIRVIYYDVHDPFWGEKLSNKVAENILSAIRNPEEAIFRAPGE